MRKAFNELKEKIKHKKYRTFSEARWEISKKSVNREISQNEYTELRILLNNLYD